MTGSIGEPHESGMINAMPVSVAFRCTRENRLWHRMRWMNTRTPRRNARERCVEIRIRLFHVFVNPKDLATQKNPPVHIGCFHIQNMHALGEVAGQFSEPDMR